MGTLFSDVYKSFLNRITDDMYMELTPSDTRKDLQNLLLNSIPGFEFPRKNLYDYTLNTLTKTSESISLDSDFILLEEDGIYTVDASSFTHDLTTEEINILAILMTEGWLQRQLTSIEVTRMKYSGIDFKMTSQANHMAKLQSLLNEIQRQSLHMQRLYKRRKLGLGGNYLSNWSILRTGNTDGSN